MKNFQALLLLFCAILPKLLISQHLVGAEISYKNIATNTFEVSLNIYKDCANEIEISNIQNISYSAASLALPAKVVALEFSNVSVIKTCDRGISVCDGGSIKSFQKKTFVGKVVLSQPAVDYKFQWLGFNRTNSLTSISNSTKGLFVEAMLNNLDAPNNSSPEFNSNPDFYVFLNNNTSYNPICEDKIDSDFIQFNLVAPMSNVNTDVVYNPGFTAINPFSTTSNVSINSTTGEMLFTPSVVNQATSLAIKATEIRNNKIIGYTIRDFQMEVLPNIPLPTISGINNENGRNEITVCTGKTVSFDIFGASPTSNVMTLSQTSSIENLILITKPSASTITGKVIFTPLTAGEYILNLKIRDNNCPIEGITTKSYKIIASPLPTINFNVPLTTILTVCNSQINIPVVPTITGSGPFNHLWSLNSNTVSLVKDFTITKSGRYSLIATDVNGCFSAKVIDYKSKIDANFTSDVTTNCENIQTTLTNKTSLLDLNTTISHYVWDFGDGSPLVTTTSSIEQKHTYTNRGKYNVILSAFSMDGCIATKADTVRIFYSPNSGIQFLLNGKMKCEFPGSILATTSLIGINDVDYIYLRYKWSVYDNLSSTPNTFSGNSLVYSTKETILGIALRTYFSGCLTKDSVVLVPNKKPIFTSVTEDFFPVCNTIPGFPNFELKALATISGAAQRISNELIYEWSSLDGVFSSPGILPIKIKNKERKYEIRVTDALGCINDTTITIKDGLIPNFNFDPYYCNTTDDVVAKDLTISIQPTVRKYIWDYGNGTTIGGVNRAIASPQTINGASFAPNNTYNIKLIVEDNSGCLDTAIVPMLRYLPKVEKFNISKTNVCFGEVITFSGVSSYNSDLKGGNNINFWKWDFGNTRSEKFINHRTFTVSGIKNIVERTIGSSTKVYGDTVFNATNFYTVPGVYNIVHTIGFNHGGFLSNPINDKINLPPYGCLLTFTGLVTVASNIAYIVDSTQNNYCVGLPTTITSAKLNPDLITNITDFSWTISQKGILVETFSGLNGDGTKIVTTFIKNGNKAYTNNPYSVNLTVKDDKGCIGTHTRLIESMKIPNASIINPQTSCQNLLLNFNINPADDPNAASIENTRWNIEGTDSIFYNNATKTPKFVFNSSTNNTHNYFVTFTGAGKFSSCTSTASGVFTTLKAPKTEFSLPEFWCNPDELSINPILTSTTNTPISSLENEWFLGNSTIPAFVNKRSEFKVTSLKNIENKITVITKDPILGCSHTATGITKVYLRPKADFSFVSTDPSDAPYVYSTSIINFKDLSTADTSKKVTRIWDFGNGVSYSKNYNRVPLDTQFVYNKSAIFYAKLTVKNTEYCKDSIIKKIDLTSYLKMPNAFNPNDEKELNRTFGVIQNGIKKLDVFKIFNRWGQLVFETSDPKIGWNGKLNNSGSDSPTGVYMYVVKAVTGYEEVQEYKGQVTLVR
ncbi:MAG: PKD domain-containing protein [Cytophagales bacterium]|nr:MAG: PKD domain-containing protein [Cytophagales bacterium]